MVPDVRFEGWRGAAMVGCLAFTYVAAARFPTPADATFEAYFLWPAAAVAHTAPFLLGSRAWLGIALGSLILNLCSWLPWPQALAMTMLQTTECLAGWWLMVRLGCPQPDLRRLRPLLLWMGTAAATSAVFSAGLGSWVTGQAHWSGFRYPLATAFSWFLGDQTALLCLGPGLLLFLGPWLQPTTGTGTRSPLTAPRPRQFLERVGLVGVCLLLAVGGVHPSLPRDVRLAFQFALVLPLLWVALRLRPRDMALGLGLLALAVLLFTWRGGRVVPGDSFRFSQLYLLVLALGGLVLAAAAEELRSTRADLLARERQALRMEAIATLAGGLVHAFNNQLTVLVGNLDRLRLLPAGSVDSDVALGQMDQAAASLEGTVRQLQDLSQQSPVRARSLPLHEALTPFLMEAASLPERISFQTDLLEDPLVGLDTERLRQALSLLLANSVEAIQGAGWIRLSALRRNGRLALVLEDSGPGMTAEVLAQACDPFFSTKAPGPHRGLGLSVAFTLAKQMGGWLTLDSQPSHGTRAELNLPIEPGSAPTILLPAAPAGARRVLLADDEPGILALTCEILETEGFAVTTAADGQAALDHFLVQPDAWDVVILDQVMPHLHGTEVMERIHQIRPNLPFLIVSGYSTNLRPELLDGPHRHFLAKPFRIRDLFLALDHLGIGRPDGGSLLGR